MTAPGDPPFPIDAEVVPQDTWLLLDGATPVQDTDAGYARLAAAGAHPSAAPGSVQVRRDTRPLRLWAVIRDLDRSPDCRREWIEAALDEVLEEVRRRTLDSLALPPLGCAEGAIAPAEFLSLLAAALRRAGVVRELRVWIPAPEPTLGATRDAIATLDF